MVFKESPDIPNHSIDFVNGKEVSDGEEEV
jgi:hypothetical protein